jgi:hypothetical protein
MKKLLMILVVLLNVVFFTTTQAQIKVNININTQPIWGPVGYNHVDYYYLPDIETYYYVPNKQFVYLSNGNWIFGYSLPVRYRSYDLYNGYKVVINEPKPYLQFKQHKIKYAHFKGNKGQGYIKNSKEPKYFGVKDHPNYKGNLRNTWDDDDKGKGNKGNKKGGKGKKG